MRFFHLSTAYPTYLQRLYAEHPGLAESAYEKQREAIRRDAFGWSDFWTHYLGRLGFEASECLANAKPAQLAWANAQGVQVDAADWVKSIAKAQIRAFTPEVLFIDDYSTFPERWVTQLRDDVPSIRLVIGWCGAPYRDPSFFRACDLVLSCIPALVKEFRASGHRSELLRHGFDSRILERIEDMPPDARYPVTFIGSLPTGSTVFDTRQRLLEYLAGRFDLAVFTPAADAGPWQRVRARLRAAIKGGSAGVAPRLRRKLRPSVFGLAMFRTLRASGITLNSHISASESSASNMRLYEATGVGTCLVTDWKDDLPGLFDPEREVVTYRSPEECAEKLTYLLEHPGERAAIASAGQARTLREHGFERRAADMQAHVHRYLQ